MREDPRCPHCEEKVSATAAWCMHCGRDFESPVDAEGGGAIDQLLGSAVTDAGTSGPSASGGVGDFDDALAVLDRSEETRQGLVVAVAGIAWFLLTVTGATGGFALLLAAAFGYYLYQLDDTATILLRSVYGAAALVVASRVFLAAASGRGLPALLDGGALFVVVALVAAGRWLDDRIESQRYSR